MHNLTVPRNLRENPHIKKLVFKSNEPLALAIGRLMMFIDYSTSVNDEIFSQQKLDEIAGWDRTDLTYMEVLEYAGFGVLVEGGLKVRYITGFPNKMRFVLAGRARAAKAKRINGRYAGSDKPETTSVVDAEGNQRNSVGKPEKEAKEALKPAKSQQVHQHKDAGLELEKSPPPSLVPPLFPPSSPFSDSSPSIPPIIPPFSHPTTHFPNAASPDSEAQQVVEIFPNEKKGKKRETDAALEARRELNLFWRESYERKFEHPYPGPVNARYNAEIKRIHEALGLAQAMEKLKWYLAWTDPWIVKQGHPIEHFLKNIVKMESDRARAMKKFAIAGKAKALQDSYTKPDQQKAEVELAYARLKAERAGGTSNFADMQQGNKPVQVSPEAGIHRKLGHSTFGGSLHPQNGGFPLEAGRKDVRPISEPCPDSTISLRVQGEGEILPTGITTATGKPK